MYFIQIKYSGIVPLLRKLPLKIINGARSGDDIAIAPFTEDAAAEINEPNEVVTRATSTTVKQHTKNLVTSLLRLHIQ